MMQKQKKQFEYTVINEFLEGKTKTYTVQLSIDGIAQATFDHKSKKVAEQKVAQLVLEKLSSL